MRGSKRVAAILLVVCLPLLGASEINVSLARVWADMWLTNQTTSFGSGDHLRFTSKHETHPEITNCDVTTTYTTSVGVASLGRCNLSPGTYLFSLSAHGELTTPSCFLYAATYLSHATNVFPETKSKFGCGVWIAPPGYVGTDSMMYFNECILTVDESSWVEARINAPCAFDKLDQAHMVIHRVKLR